MHFWQVLPHLYTVNSLSYVPGMDYLKLHHFLKSTEDSLLPLNPYSPFTP